MCLIAKVGSTFLRIMGGRLVEAQVVKGLYSKLGLVPALTHIARLGDEAVVVEAMAVMAEEAAMEPGKIF